MFNFKERKKIKELLEKINKHVEEFHKKGLYTLFESSFISRVILGKPDFEKINYFYEVVMEWESNPNTKLMPLELGKDLEELITSNMYTVGIHKMNISPSIYESEKAKNVLENGLDNYGDLSEGIVMKDPSIVKTVVIHNNLFSLFVEMQNKWRDSNGCFLFAFPNEYLDKEGTINESNKNLIYNYGKDGHAIIKPEYIQGFIGLNTNVMTYMSKEEILEYNNSIRKM